MSGGMSSVSGILVSLKDVEVFGRKIECGLSKHPFIGGAHSAGQLPDGTPSVLDCAGSRLHRIRPGPQRACCRPGPVLHYFNAPTGITVSKYVSLFVERGVKPPAKIQIFAEKTGRSNERGLMEWSSLNAAAEAIIMMNHVELGAEGKLMAAGEGGVGKGSVHTFKLAFSMQQCDATAVLTGVSTNSEANVG